MEPNDKLLKEKLEAYQAPFDAAAWQGMEQLLQQKKKRRFLVWWWWLGTSLAAAIAVISLLLLTPKENAIGSNPAIATANSYNHKNFTENTTHNTYSTTRSTDAKTPVTTTTQAEVQQWEACFQVIVRLLSRSRLPQQVADPLPQSLDQW